MPPSPDNKLRRGPAPPRAGRVAQLIALLTPHLELDDHGVIAGSGEGPPAVPAEFARQLSPTEALLTQSLVNAGDAWARFIRGEKPAPGLSATRGHVDYASLDHHGAPRARLDEALMKGVEPGMRNALVCRWLLERAKTDAKTAQDAAVKGDAFWTIAADCAAAAANAATPHRGDPQKDLADAEQELANALAAQDAINQLAAYLTAAQAAAADATAACHRAAQLRCGELSAIESATAAAQAAASDLSATWNSIGLVLVAAAVDLAITDANARITRDTKTIADTAAAAAAAAAANQAAVTQAQSLASCILGGTDDKWYGVAVKLDEGCTTSLEQWLANEINNQLDPVTIAKQVANLFSTNWWTSVLWADVLADAALLRQAIIDSDQGSGVTIHFSWVAAVTNAILTGNPAFALTAVTLDLTLEVAVGGYNPSGLSGLFASRGLIASNVVYVTGN